MEGCRHSTLDVIVEGAVTIPVLVEDSERVTVGKVLKLDQTVHPVPAAGTLTGQTSLLTL